MKTEIICAACNHSFPHLRGLLDHYQEKHPELLKRYSIRHLPSKTTITMKVPDEHIILDWQHWREKDCKINIL